MGEFGERRPKPDQQLTRRQDVVHDPRNWYNRPHEELVQALGSFVEERYRRLGGYQTPVEIIRGKLEWENSSLNRRKGGDFYFTLRNAWDALAYDRYEAGSCTEGLAGSILNAHAGSTDGGQEIRLTDPLQVKIIDALTEVAGIPHNRGQTVIEIPEKLKGENYRDWLFSAEYQSRVEEAKARRRR